MGTFASWGILWLITAGTVLPLSYVGCRLALSDRDEQKQISPVARHSAAVMQTPPRL